MNVGPGSRTYYNTHGTNSQRFSPKDGNSTCEMKKLTSKKQGTAAIHRDHDGRYSYCNLARLSSETNEFPSCLGLLASHGTFELF